MRTLINGKASSSHTHICSEITDLQSELDTKANLSHEHTISNISGLQAALDLKANSSDITSINTRLTTLENKMNNVAIALRRATLLYSGDYERTEGKNAIKAVYGTVRSDIEDWLWISDYGFKA